MEELKRKTSLFLALFARQGEDNSEKETTSTTINIYHDVFLMKRQRTISDNYNYHNTFRKKEQEYNEINKR